jgi:hypothetical protein
LTDPYTPLTATLDEYFAAIPLQGQAGAPDLLVIFEKLDALEASLSPSLPPDLKHFLSQKSYRKAWLWLQDRHEEITRGQCGRGT